jgi:hypothetical protein
LDSTERKAVRKYWAKHQGGTRWGVRTPLEPADESEVYTSRAGHLFVWADVVELRDGALVFRTEEGVLKAAIAPGGWDAVYEASEDDSPGPVESR